MLSHDNRETLIENFPFNIYLVLKLDLKMSKLHQYISVNMDLVYSSCKLLVLVAVCLKLCTTQGMEIYVKPSSSTPCPVKTCLTLSLLSTKSVLNSLKQNTTLLFLPGDYTLESKISITNVSEFSMISLSSGSSNVSIFCHKDVSFKFEGINRLSIRGFKFFGCGSNKAKLVKNFSLENTSFVGENKSETALEFDKTKVCIIDSSFMHNTVGSLRGPIRLLQGCKHQCAYVGGAIIANQSHVAIIRSEFVGNRAEIGGAIFATHGSKVIIKKSSFIGNSAVNCSVDLCFGGVLYTDSGVNEVDNMLAQTSAVLNESEFSTNAATNGAVLTAINCSINIYSSKIFNNMAEMCGGVLWIQTGTLLKVSSSKIANNQALTGSGGVAYVMDASSFTVNESEIYCNSAVKSGGVVHADYQTSVGFFDSFLWNNSAQQVGGVIAILENNRVTHHRVDTQKRLTIVTIIDSNFKSNFANFTGGVGSIEYAKKLILIRSTFMKNLALLGGGVFDVELLSVTIKDAKFASNQAQEGGAFRLFQSIFVFAGSCNFTENSAIIGGVIHAAESTVLRIRANTLVYVWNNVAYEDGGGLYLYNSKVLCALNSIVEFIGNVASRRGGAIQAINSIIHIESGRDSGNVTSMRFTNNGATFGGAVHLELSSELVIVKLGECHDIVNLCFTSNTANYGGAIYVNDETYYEICHRSEVRAIAYKGGTNCFIQVTSQKEITDFRKYISLEFSNNIANINGSVLFGGLLDRCTLSNTVRYSSPSGMISQYIDGVTYFKNISNITSQNRTNMITSRATNICFCNPINNQPNCSFQPPAIPIKRGEEFNVSVVAVNQVNETVARSVAGITLYYTESDLGDGQRIQKIDNKCTNLTFNVHSPHPTETLTIYAQQGPCLKASRSTKLFYMYFVNCECPVGFQQKQVNKDVTCECICDSQLYPYITDPNCDPQTGILLKDGNFWITNLTITTDGSTGYKYILYPHCPYDYCLPYCVHINLNLVNGADAQCANNRSGLLCGACKPGLSLSLGSSLCISCSKSWHRGIIVILISFFVSGILLVVSIMVLNLTVAVGTLNGIIFYANIVGANMSIFFPMANLRFISIFLSWLNLEVGFDACFYDGMDTYWKIWLQLAFPVYIIILVIIIIVVSDHSMKFSGLLARRNPVATLATLILLSYTKLLSIVISSISFGIITYPNDSHEIIWLPDASVKYLKGKHVALFILGTLILLIGVFYTFLLFSWQWLLRYQELKLLKWIGHQRLCHFIEPYHAPYAFKHRYWTGLLLLARVILYLVFALNKSGDPGVNLIAISIVSCSLMFLKGLVSRVYKNFVVEAISMTCYLNMALLSVSTFFLQENRSFNQSIFALMSGITVILLLLLVLTYHIFIEVFLKVWKKLHKQVIKSSDEANDLSNISQIDFDSRDHSPLDESMDEYLKTNHRELSTLPDCGNSLQKQRDEQHKAPLHRNSFSDDDTDSVGSMTPLLN